MRIFRSVMITTLAATALLAAATPTFAQATPQAPKEQGLGIFLQGGYVYQTTYTGGSSFESTPQGFIAGIGLGGNKSGAFGVGVDLNYMWTNNSDADQKSQTLDIPVYGRFNIGGHRTKNAPTFFIPVGWFFDINLSNKIGDFDVTEGFEGFQTGPLVGLGFEVYRIGIEGRAQWAVTNLLKDGSVFGTVDAKQFTFIVLFKVRLH